MQKQKIRWHQWISMCLFLGYLAFANGSFNGNSLLIAAASVVCLAIGLLQCGWIRKKIMKQSGIIEIDLEKDDVHDQ